MKKFLILFLLVLFIGTGVISCGGGGGSEADKVDVSQALDDGDYDTVIDYYTSNPPDEPMEKIELASAYLGKAGVDTINVIEKSGDLSDSTDEDKAFDVISSAVGDTTIDNESLTEKREYINEALKTTLGLSRLIAAIDENGNFYCDTNEDSDLRAFGAIAAAIDTVLILSDTILNVYKDEIESYNGCDNESCWYIKLDSNWIEGLFDNMTNYKENDVISYLDNSTADNKTYLDQIVENLKIVDCGIQVLTGDNLDQLKSDFDEFIVDVCGSGGLDNCSSNQVANYIIEQLGK